MGCSSLSIQMEMSISYGYLPSNLLLIDLGKMHLQPEEPRLESTHECLY